MSNLYDISITGNTLPGFEAAQVKEAFSKKFNIPLKNVELLFSTTDPFVVKKGVDEVTANKYLAVIEKLGAEANKVEVEPLEQPLEVEELQTNTERSSSEAAVSDMEGAKSEYDESNSTAGEEQGSESLLDEHDASGLNGKEQQDAQEPETSAPLSLAETGDPTSYPFEFTGKGWEYFKIWIVNVLLTIVTIGIYSAWAKVRNNRYMYSNLSVAGSSFQYHATPMMILKSRLIALGFFLTVSILSQINAALNAVFFLALFIGMPWIMVSALKFRAKMSSWRGIHFGFDGTIKDAAMVFILWPIVGVLTFGLMMPYALYKQTFYVLNNSRFGTSKFSMTPCAGAYVKVYLMALGGVVAAFVVSGLLGSFIHFAISAIIMFGAYIFAFAFIAVQVGNLVMENWTAEGNKIGFTSSMDEISYIKLVAKNTILTVLTLGFYMPAAMVNVARYRADTLALNSEISLANFVAQEEQKVGALGEEMGDMFDVDVAI